MTVDPTPGADAHVVEVIGGPLDGTQLEVSEDAEELVVTMVDRTQHIYRQNADGAWRYQGRH